MKLKLWFILVSAVLAIGLCSPAFAFHSGGVADCDGCNSMHNTPNALPTGSPTTSATGGPMLLAGSDQSSTCLNCHANASTGSYHVMTWPFAGGTNVATIPVNRNPGGDFAWLLLNFSYTSHGSTTSNPGGGHGHNIIAADFGMTNNSGYTTAPGGGSFVAANLHCNSCHDPHNKLRRDSGGNIDSMVGNTTQVLPIIGSGSYPTSVTGTVGTQAPGANQAVGVYRLLAGYPTYSAAGQTIGYTGVPIAIAPSTYNQTEATNQVRVAYGNGTATNMVTWGTWCATCHPNMLNGIGNHYHPVDANAVLSSGNEQTNYNSYVGSGNMTGNSLTAYQSLVPFMMGGATAGGPTWAALAGAADNTGTVTAAKQGPGSYDQASCLSCHRAHASGWRDALRWNMQGEFITYVTSTGTPTWPGTDTTSGSPGYADGMLSTQVSAAYYDRTVVASPTGPTQFASFQRSLCNKCHAQD
jgi:hypothetical protein